MNIRVVEYGALLALCAGVALGASEGNRGRAKGDPKQPSQNSTCNDVPAHPLDVVLGQPTRDSVTLSVLAYQDIEGGIAYGTQPGHLTRQTPTRRFANGEPVELVIGSLQADTRYFYQFRSRSLNGKEAAFHTQRFYFGRLCHAAPLFLVLGNHDGESPRGRGSDADGLAVWSNRMRKRYFPNPTADGFFTGNAARHPEAGLLQDYYAWQWGDALFVVLDPFWFTQKQPGKGGPWRRSLGAEQYQWLHRTLEASKVKFKLIFIHHLVGGTDDQGRGGAEAAPFFEWGGKNADGSDGFTRNRPGWPAPVHQVLVQSRVSIVFHGHDHLYAKQDLDGIVYQEVPQPGNQGNGRAPRYAAEYGYRDGVILGGSGHVRVAVSPDKLTVDYVGVDVLQDEHASRGNRHVSHSYTITAR